MPKGYIIAHITVEDPEAYREYVEKDTPILTGLGGRFIVRGGQSEVVEGASHDRHVVIEFDDYASAERAYRDPDTRLSPIFAAAPRKAQSSSQKGSEP